MAGQLKLTVARKPASFPTGKPAITLAGRLKVEVELTERELEMITLLVADTKYFAIAEELRISFSQTKFLIGQLYLKLGIHGRGSLGVWAAKHGLV